MYGGGFATVPAYLADLFGTQHVGAIHGRLLTAWSMAGILGPVLVNYIREFQIARGVPAAQAYNVTLYVLAALLVVGFFCNLAIRPVDSELFTVAPASALRNRAGAAMSNAGTVGGRPAASSGWALVAGAWLLVALPLSWGVFNTIALALQMVR